MALVECVDAPEQFAADPQTVQPRPRRTRIPRNLVLVYRRRRPLQRNDFQRIADLIARKAPDIHPVVMMDRWYHVFSPRWFLRPSLVFSSSPIRRFWIPNVAAFHGRWMSKSEEMERLERAGISVPRWAVVTRDTQPDLSDFGRYVVVKPNMGCRGAEVKIKRAGRVRWKPPVNHDAVRLKEDRRLVQQFIYTGAWPVSYRVTTLFGRALFSWRVEASRRRRPLAGRDKFNEGGESGGGISICASGEGCTFTLNEEADVVALGEQAHRAFPDIPFLGFDIVRDHDSGQLYVVEANSNGLVWHFSGETGEGIQRDNQINFDNQWGGLERAADALIEATRQYAR